MKYERYAYDGIWLVLALAFLWNLGLFLDDLVTSATWPGAMSITGGVVAFQAWRPDLWFQPLTEPPIFPTTYPPVYPAIVGGLYRLFGGAVDLFVLGRAVTQLAILGTAGMIGHLVYRRADRAAPAIVAAVLYLFSPLVARPVVHLRVDYLAVAIGVASLYWFLTRHGRRAIVGAALLAVLAAWTKQTMIAPAVALPVALAIDRQWRPALASGVGIAGTGLGALGLLSILTGGVAWTHLVENSTAFPMVPRLAVEQTVYFLLVHWPTLVIAAVGVWLTWGRSADASLVPIYTVVALEVGLIAVAKEGAWTGYFVPALAGAAILAGYAAARFDRKAFTDHPIAAVMVVLLLASQLGYYTVWTPPPMFDEDAQAAIAERVEDVDGRVLSEAPGLLVRADKRQEGYEALMMKTLAREGRWDQTVFVKRIRAQRYALLITRSNMSSDRAWTNGRWTQVMVDAVRSAYRFDERVGGYYVYVPART